MAGRAGRPRLGLKAVKEVAEALGLPFRWWSGEDFVTGQVEAGAGRSRQRVTVRQSRDAWGTWRRPVVKVLRWSPCSSFWANAMTCASAGQAVAVVEGRERFVPDRADRGRPVPEGAVGAWKEV